MLLRLCLFATLLLATALYATLNAQAKKPTITKPKTKIDSIAAKRDSLWKDAVKEKKKLDGLFTLYQDTASGSLQLYIKKDQLGKEFIYQSFSMGGPGSLFLNQNMLRETWVFMIKKNFNRLDFIRCNTNFYYDPSNAISRSANPMIPRPIFLVRKVAISISLNG